MRLGVFVFVALLAAATPSAIGGGLAAPTVGRHHRGAASHDTASGEQAGEARSAGDVANQVAHVAARDHQTPRRCSHRRLKWSGRGAGDRRRRIERDVVDRASTSEPVTLAAVSEVRPLPLPLKVLAIIAPLVDVDAAVEVGAGNRAVEDLD